MSFSLKLLLLFLLAALFWLGVARGSGVGEAWDAAGYWTIWYPVSLLLVAGGGYVVGRRSRRNTGWVAGAIVTAAQLPVMGLGAAGSGLLPAGLLVLLVLAIPAMAVAALAGWVARKKKAARGAGRLSHGIGVRDQSAP